VQNKDMQRHFNESISEHSMLVVTQSQEVQAQIRETKLIIERQRREKIDCFVIEADKIKGELVAAQSRISTLQRNLKEAKQRHKELKQRHDQKKLELQFQKNTSLQADLEHLVRESRVKCYGPALPRLHPSEIISRPGHSPMTTDESVPPVMFLIPNFHTERRNDARIYLPPFYTHRRGYKLSMIVCCNGNDTAIKGHCLTVYMSMLKGLYDTSLAWPLNCIVNFQIATTGDLKVRVNSQRVLDDCGFSSFSCARYLEFSRLKNLPDHCLGIQVCSVAF
jgi:hypothetical protein